MEELIDKYTEIISLTEVEAFAKGVIFMEGLKADIKIDRLGRNYNKIHDNWNEVFDLWDKKEITGKEAMEMMGLKRNSFYKLVEEYRKANKEWEY